MRGIERVEIVQNDDCDFPWKCRIAATWPSVKVYYYMREIDQWCTDSLEADCWQTASVVWSTDKILNTEYRFQQHAHAVLFQMRWNP